MTDTMMKPPLGVGALIGETFRIYAQRFVPVTLAAFLPYLATTLITAAFLGIDVAVGQDPDDPTELNFAAFPIVWILSSIATAIATGVVVQIAYGVKTNRSIPIGVIVAHTMRSLVPIVVLTIVTTVLAGIAAVALILPGLYLWAMWSLIVPAIVVESAGFGAMRRSAELTKDYRWPVLGTLTLILVCMIGVSILLTALLAIVMATAGGIVALVLQSLLGAIPFALLCVLLALIYARLREIKEGISVDSIVDVFA